MSSVSPCSKTSANRTGESHILRQQNGGVFLPAPFSLRLPTPVHFFNTVELDELLEPDFSGEPFENQIGMVMGSIHVLFDDAIHPPLIKYPAVSTFRRFPRIG